MRSDRRGERNGRARMTEAQVLKMRELWASGIETWALAERYGIARVTVEKIVYGMNWKHLPLTHREH